MPAGGIWTLRLTGTMLDGGDRRWRSSGTGRGGRTQGTRLSGTGLATGTIPQPRLRGRGNVERGDPENITERRRSDEIASRGQCY